MNIERLNTRLFVLFAFAFLCLYGSAAAADAPLRKVRMAFTSLSGSMIPPWLARQAGIFAKHGLDVEVIATPSGVEGMNALIAGEVQFLQIAGGTTASAALGGADVMIIGTTIDTFVQHLVGRPEIEKPEQLRGKTIGITRFGTSIDTGARVALRHFGLNPEKDVAIVQVGGMESAVPALQANRVQAAILSFPAIGRAHKLGMKTLLDVATLNIPYASTGMSTRGRTIREDPDLVRRYMMAQVEGIARAKRDRPLAMSVMGKYLRITDNEVLGEAYDIYVTKHLARVPMPTVEALRGVLDELAQRNPKAKEMDPKRFFDDSFVRQMQASGFIDGLYR